MTKVMLMREACFELRFAGWIGFVGLLFALLQGCSVQPGLALEGVFVNHAKSEFSFAADTLIVDHVAQEEFLMQRRTGIQMRDELGQVGKLILEGEQWKGVFDAEREVMIEQRRGRELRLSGEDLVLEKAVYRRISK
ncbi:hypothetical protein [Pedobacter deserti]|uniref:hypothetical protein n=1 Tax=Pedobacter deserti TaxID=2817382 RepID=UPI00210D3CC1|nr:hypothetical protein [Pedobacter sp. SYSU D00382]